MWEKGLLIWGFSWAVAFLLIGQDIQYVAYPTTAHSVQFCVATVGTRYSSKLLVLKVQEPRQAWTCRPNFPTSILCSWTFYTTELMLLHSPTPYIKLGRLYMPCFSITAVHTLPESCLVFSIIFSSSACTPMYNYGCTWKKFEAKDGSADTV